MMETNPQLPSEQEDEKLNSYLAPVSRGAVNMGSVAQFLNQHVPLPQNIGTSTAASSRERDPGSRGRGRKNTSRAPRILASVFASTRARGARASTNPRVGSMKMQKDCINYQVSAQSITESFVKNSKLA